MNTNRDKNMDMSNNMSMDMNQELTVVPLKKKDTKKAALAVANAFFDYPSLKEYFPDPVSRKWKLPWYMEHTLKSALRYGEVLTTNDGSGVLFLLPPGHTRLTDWDYVKSGFLAAPLVVGIRQYAVVSASETFLADTQERLLAGRAHYYLWGIAVNPARQRTGAGSALLKRMFERADRETMPIYLETHQHANVAYYEQRGFQLIHTGTMPGGELSFWCMLREPQAKE